MPLLRLVDPSAPARTLDARRVHEGALTVGRDPGDGGWAVRDPERAISRAHCVFAERGGRLTVRDVSANGVRLEGAPDPLPRGEDVTVSPGDVLRLGSLSIVVAADEIQPAAGSPFAVPGRSSATTAPQPSPPAPRPGEGPAPASGLFDAPFSRPLLEPGDPLEATVSVPSAWTDGATAAAPAAAAPTDASLLEAFCAGAGLDLSALSGAEARDTLFALGSVYRQMVLGLSDLMAERVTVKGEFRMSRTTVQAENNNPFKWAGAQRVAADLLRAPAEGFLAGPEAVNECFADLKTHVLCLIAGMRSAVEETLRALDPDATEARLEGRSFLMRPRAAVAWETHRATHADFAEEARRDPESRVNAAFRAGYEARLNALDARASR